jgi:hypothetical protein
MSLLACAVFEHYVVVASDSRAVKIERGCVVPVGDRYCKFWTLDEGRIAVGLTGSFLMGEILSRFTHEIAERCRGSEELFATLEQAIPEFMQIVNPVIAKHMDEIYRGEIIPSSLTDCDLQKSIPLLCGYDNSQKKIRGIYWEQDSVPVNCEAGSVIAGGPKKASELVTELISKEIGDVFTPGNVAKAMKRAIHVVAQDSEIIGGAIRTHLIMTPSFEEHLKRLNEIVAKEFSF